MHWVSAHQRWEAALLGAQCQEYFQFCKQANKNICLGPWAYIEWVTLFSNKIMDGKERLVSWNKLILYIQFSIPPKKKKKIDWSRAQIHWIPVFYEVG